MKKILLLLLCAPWMFSLSAQSPLEKFDPTLLERFTSNPSSHQEFIVELSDQVDTRALLARYESEKTPLTTRSQEVITLLQTTANTTQPALLEELRKMEGVDQSLVYPVWIVNAVFVRANYDAALKIAGLPIVGNLSFNAPVEIVEPVKVTTAVATPNGTEPGLRAIKAPFMWKLGYTGYGRKALIIDTGDDGQHPALIANFWGNNVPTNQAWNGTGLPEDCADHGTHVTGTVVGLDRKTNDTIGVAFNAHWMGGPMQFPIGEELGCQRAFSQTVFSNIQTFQWALNPDGNATTITDQPDAINCSWSSGNFGCGNNVAINLLNATEAAGVAVVFAQGNNGPDPSTVTSGASMNMDLVNTFAVGAINGANASFPIASFSSRGPTPCGGTGSLLIKPEVVAPGVSVRSAFNGGAYASIDGTSMAAPHAAGAIVLLKEAFPYLSGIQLKLALYNSAIDLGVVGEDNAHGNGMISLEAAYNWLLNEGNVPVTPVTWERDALIIDTKVAGICKGPVVPTVTVENAGTETITSLDFSYGLLNGTQSTYTWNGGLAPNSFTSIVLPGLTGINPGEYTVQVTITSVNGTTDVRPLNNSFKRVFKMANEDYIVGKVNDLQSSICGGSRVLLEATSSIGANERFQWFTAPLTGNPVSETNTFLTPTLTQNTTYYLSKISNYKVGKTAITGNSTTSTGAALQFNVFQPIVLKTVKVYADETGNRFIRLLDSDGNQITQKIVNITQTGEQRITLNLSIPVGNGYRLELSGGKELKQTTTQPGFPHTVSGVMTIVRGITPAGNNTTLNYYYFFDWEIDVPFICGRTAVPVTVSPSPTAPVVSIGTSADTIDLATTNTITFNDQSADVVSRYWDFGNGQTSTEANPVATYSQIGSYKVLLVIVTSNGCSNVTEKTVVVKQTSSSWEATNGITSNISIFPNPSSGNIFLRFESNTAPENGRLIVTDLLGRTTQLPELQLAAGADLVQLNVGNLTAGIYFVRLYEANQLVWSGKFIKQ